MAWLNSVRKIIIITVIPNAAALSATGRISYHLL